MDYKPLYLHAAAVFIMTVLFSLTMAYELIGFSIAGSVFVFLTISTLGNFQKKAMMLALLIGVTMGFGCNYLFTEIFSVDLPQ